MRVLVYKRTHNGDPDAQGCFGAMDCMGATRAWDFEAVVGVGGLGPEPVAEGIAGQVNWVGVGPHKTHAPDKRGPYVHFERFIDFGTAGPRFQALAPVLAGRMYADNVRALMDGLTAEERREVAGILKLADAAAPSPGFGIERAEERRVSGPPAKRARCRHETDLRS